MLTFLLSAFTKMSELFAALIFVSNLIRRISSRWLYKYYFVVCPDTWSLLAELVQSTDWEQTSIVNLV